MSTDEAQALLLARGWLAEQPPALQQAIFLRGRLRRLDPGAPIFLAGDRPDGVYAVISGQIKLVYVLPEGREVVLWAAEPGFWFGVRDLLVPQAVRYAAAVATSTAVIFHLPKNGFSDLLAEEPGYTVNFAGIMAHNLLLALRYISEVLSQPAAIRVARLLALLCETAGPDERGRHEVRLPQQDLAAMLGLSRVTVGKALRTLEAERLVTVRYGRIAVLDVHGLALR
jgi:CRP-like cAMP-binding protein